MKKYRQNKSPGIFVFRSTYKAIIQNTIEKRKKLPDVGILLENKYTNQCQVAIELKHFE